MRAVRLIGLALAIVSLNACSSRKNTTNAVKIVGTWESTKLVSIWESAKLRKSRREDDGNDTRFSTVLKFTREGKLSWTARINDLPVESKGEYRIEGDMIVATGSLSPEADSNTAKLKINTLTDTTLVLDNHGRIEEFKKK